LAGVFLLVVVPLLARSPYSLPPVLRKSGPVRSVKIAIPNLKAATPYAILLAIRTEQVFGAESRIGVDLTQNGSELIHKTLHMGDPDLFALFRVPKDGAAELNLEVLSKLAAPGTYLLEVHRWPTSRRPERAPDNPWLRDNAIARNGQGEIKSLTVPERIKETGAALQ
jgi:hypothetical protein